MEVQIRGSLFEVNLLTLTHESVKIKNHYLTINITNNIMKSETNQKMTQILQKIDSTENV